MPPTPESRSSFSAASAENHHSAPPLTSRETQPTSLFRYLLRFLLPPACQLCGAPLSPHAAPPHLCAACTPGSIHQPPAACPICAEPYVAFMVAVHPCVQCAQHPPAFTWLKTIGIHAEDLQHAVHQLKYAGRFHLAQPLAQLLHQRLYSAIVEFAPQAIIPVPLHPKRLRERGFNQSLLVAQHLGTALKTGVNSHYLMRIRATRSQTDLTREQRRQNLQGAFALHGFLEPQRILLVDDVVTTTATCRECANTLAKAGHEVAVVALGRARLHN